MNAYVNDWDNPIPYEKIRSLSSRSVDNYLECIAKFQNGIEVGYREELVRCKDCTRGEPGVCGDGVVCDGVWHDNDWFCADGERR